MKFAFHLRDCASSNSDEARVREATRLAMICHRLREQGHDAVIETHAPVFEASNRWEAFRHLRGKGGADWLAVHPAESLRRGLDRCDVAFKCSVGVQDDAMYLSKCRLLVAHEYADDLHNHPKLLKTTFGVHHNIFDSLIPHGLMGDFLENRLQPIRDFFRDGVTPHEKPVGFYGQHWAHRRALLETAPDWVQWGLYDHSPEFPAMPTYEHTKWVCGFRAYLALRGDSPKTNLPPLLAMLGVPMVYEFINRTDTPPIDDTNSIPLGDWHAVRQAVEVPSVLMAVAHNATEDWIRGWSPDGQARLIMERVQ